MDKAKVKRIAVSTAAVASILLGATAANAQDARLKSIVDEVNQANKIAQASQQKIDTVADATAKLFAEYKGVLKTNAGLRAYNAQQNRVIKKQEEEIDRIKDSIGRIDEVKRQITPLMLEMIDNLSDFVHADIPFQIKEREDRITKLKADMDNPNIADPERFRVVLDAYKAEVSYGRTLNAYEDTLADGRSVNFVRIGRVGFYYQTKDGKETGVWNRDSNSWERKDDFGTSVKQLIKMAHHQIPLDILVLPIEAPKEK